MGRYDEKKIAESLAKLSPEVLAELDKQLPRAAKQARMSAPALRCLIAAAIEGTVAIGGEKTPTPEQEAGMLIGVAIDLRGMLYSGQN